MTNKKILEKAIQKAIAGGWDVFSTENHQIDVVLITLDMLDDPENYHNEAPHSGLTVYIRRNGYYAPDEIIFNHEFAKALWSTREMWTDERLSLNKQTCEYKTAILSNNKSWQFHLQMMVVALDPIKYLGEHLDD